VSFAWKIATGQRTLIDLKGIDEIMTPAIDHELTFCSAAAGWMNQELETRPELEFSRVAIEQSSRGSRTRRDLTIYDRTDKIAIAGEVKLPYMPDGGSPYNESVVEDAFRKAGRAGARFFVTWNVNRIVIWRTDDAGKPLFDRHFHEETLAQVRDENDLANPTVQSAIRRGLARFLERASQAYSGVLPLAKRPLDESFITVLEAALERPITTTLAAITAKYAAAGAFKNDLNRWMREVQQWQLSENEQAQRDNLERAAKLSCYVLANRIVFYHALRRRFSRLAAIRIPAILSSANQLADTFNGYFRRAKEVTRDYETVFDGDFADTLPFLSSATVSPWRDFLDSIDRFDFTKLDYDVIGLIFVRLTSPEERHRYGQHYTKAEIVDLIEAFCIREPGAVVLDPSCGGGTFLVRAYARKKYLAQKVGHDLPHEKLLEQLFGVDISAYAAHLTTMNLATRDLIDEQNYPLVAQSDFFDVRRGEALFHVPMAAGAKSKQLRPVIIGEVDTVVGNPPYVRQEEISKPPKTTSKNKLKAGPRSLEEIKAEADAYKKHLMHLAREAWPQGTLSGRSDLHVFFWPHAGSLLRPGGYFGFLTSSAWLDVEYGFHLQEFILEHYAIIAVFESQVEPWFTGARVTTCATILRKEPDREKREANLVRFVQLRSPLSAIFPAETTEERRQISAEALRDRIEDITSNRTDPHWRVRVVNQGDLYRLGLQPSGASDSGEGSETGLGDVREAGAYCGSKWGVYLRAPDLFFDLKDRYRDRLVQLGKVADVKFGLKTGSDGFFFVRDVTDRCLAQTIDPLEFKSKYGIQRVQADKVRIVLAGDESLHLIEAEFLEPEVHSLTEIRGGEIDESTLGKKVFLCGRPKGELDKTYALRYIAWGEKERHHRTVSVATRGASRLWYDITDCVRPQLILPKIQQYRHVIALNPERWTCNSSQLAISTGDSPALLAAVLNSTLVGFVKWFCGRQLGNEANLQMDVYAAKTLPIPDPRHVSAQVANRLKKAMTKLAGREIIDLDEEVGTEDRRDLDDAVFQLLGEESAQARRDWIDKLYVEIRSFHGAMKEKELLAMKNRLATSRGSSVSPADMAGEIWAEIAPSLKLRFPEAFIERGEAIETVELTEGKFKTSDEPLMGRIGFDIDGRHTELGDERRLQLVRAIFAFGRRGAVPIPRSGEACLTILTRFRAYDDQVLAEFSYRVAEKTANEKMQAKVLNILKHKLGNLEPAL
jgi:type I restriction-modification system DNA methylase subunit